MPHTHPDLSLRTRRALSATALGLLTAAIAFSPASAVDDCDGLAADAADYEGELRCASSATEGEQVITLTDNFSVPDGAQNTYDGELPLTVEGAHDGVTITGPGFSESFDATVFLAIGSDMMGPLALETEPLAVDDAPAALAEVPVELEGEGADVTVRNLTITDFNYGGAIINSTARAIEVSRVTMLDNGAPIGEGFELALGAAVSSAGDVTVTDSHFEGNQGAYGAAVSTIVALFGSGTGESGFPTVTVADSTFVDNAGALGGAVLSLGDTTITGSDFTSNTAIVGGAVGAFGATSAISDSTFTDNSAAPMEGQEGVESPEAGALAIAGALTLTNSVLTGNSSEGLGGAIGYSYGPVDVVPSLEIIDSVLAGNTAEGPGGAVWFNGDVDVTSSTFVDNSSVSGPSAIAASSPEEDATVTNATFTGNSSAASAPAVALDGADSLTVTHATFSENVAAGAAADLAVVDVGQTTLTASVWASGASVPSCEIDGDLSTAANFDIDGSCTGDWSGAGDLGEGLDPQLGALADNGGATPTLLPAVTSPLVDAVADDASDLAVDQRGVTRPQGEANDIGAVELAPADRAALIEFQVTTDAGVIHGTASPALAVTDIAWIATADLAPAPPADTMLPYGAAAFSVEVARPGDAVTITLTAPRPFTTVLKSGVDGWSEVEGATFSDNGTTVTYTLTDGGDLDEDGEANGIIVDPVALAVQGTFTG